MNNETPQRPSQKNRRIAIRRKPCGYVQLECRKGSIGLGKNVATMLLDVSETGARLVISLELPAMQQVELIISATGIRNSIKRFGLVRWQLKLDDGTFCIGVEFEKRLDYADVQKLAAPN